MYCFNCGAHTTPGQNFCRACGSNLKNGPENVARPSSTKLTPSRRLQIMADTVTHALRSGMRTISRPPTSHLDGHYRADRFRHWGLIAFWAGLAALLGNYVGVILVLTGIGLMAYARGFFGPAGEAVTARTSKVEVSSTGETRPTETPFRSAAVSESLEN